MTQNPLDEVFAELPSMLAVEHIVELTHLTARTIRSKLATGEIPDGRRISRNRWLVPKSSVRGWLETRDTTETKEHTP